MTFLSSKKVNVVNLAKLQNEVKVLEKTVARVTMCVCSESGKQHFITQPTPFLQ